MTDNERAGWLADKLHNGGDYGKEAAGLLIAQAAEIDRLRAALAAAQAPQQPARVALSDAALLACAHEIANGALLWLTIDTGPWGAVVKPSPEYRALANAVLKAAGIPGTDGAA